MHCRCFQDGRAASAPVEVEFDLDDGIVCPDGLAVAQVVEFEQWMDTGCAHADMTVVRVQVSNWFDLYRFQVAVALVGRSRLPALSSELPSLNGGHAMPDVAQRILHELDVFEASDVAWEDHVLVDVNSGMEVNRRIEGTDGVFLLDGRKQVEAGIDADGQFFVRDRGTHVVRFFTKEFTQEPGGEVHASKLRSASGDRLRSAVLRAPDGSTFELSSGLSTDNPDDRHLMRVEQFTTDAFDFRALVDALRRVATASTTTGNPIHWT